MKKLTVFVLALILITCTGVILFRTPKRETLNSYIEGLRNRGEKMTWEELMRSLSPHTNDSLAILTNAIQKLGPPPAGATNVDLMRFVSPSHAQVSWRMHAPKWVLGTGNSKAITWTDIRAEVEQSSASLTRLHEASKRPPLNAGFRKSPFERATPFRDLQRASLWLASEALCDLNAGDLPGALASIQAIAGIADFHSEEFSLVSQMTRAAVTGIGLRLTWEALQTNGWNDEQLFALQKRWEGMNILEASEKGLVGERCFGRESLKRLQPEGSLGSLSNSYYGTNLLDADLLFQLRHVQSYIGEARSLRTNRPWPEVSKSLDRLTSKLEELENSPQRVRYPLTLLSTPNFKRAVFVNVQRETERRLVITAIGLERYKRRHGQFPDRLELLVPGVLASVPLDCMSGQPLRYRHKPEDSFILYSVGEDGKDDGGATATARHEAKLGLWEGRDVVWPIGF
jgi:hypothetical protein